MGFTFARNPFFQNNLINMYAKCGNLMDARKLFDRMTERDIFSWNMIIAAYRKHGFPEEALQLFHQIKPSGVEADQFTFVSILPACAKMGAHEHGIIIHQRIIERGLLSNVVVASALIDMYAKCGSIQKACELFDKLPKRDAVSWNSMIAGYVQNGVLDQAVKLFKEMPQPNVVSWNAIIAGYAQNGAFDEAMRLFEEMPQPNVVSWNAIIAGYAQNGFVEKALEIFKQMQLARVKPDSATFAGVLPACAKTGALEQGMEFHQRIIKSGFLSDVAVVNSIIDMYAKCGSIKKAHDLFDKMHHPNVVSWTAMIAGYAMHGYGKDALKVFEAMKDSQIQPNHVSFICVLFACSHTGLVDEGGKYFNCMTEAHYIIPTMDHYVCMADLLGRVGYLEEALNFIIKMPLKPDVDVWMSLLGVCRSHENIELGEFAAEQLFELDPKHTSSYVLLSDIYAKEGKWAGLQKIRKLSKDRGIKKIPGCSWIEVHKMVHVFCVGDRSHPQTEDIYKMLEILTWEMKAAGYLPDSRHVSNDVEEEERELYMLHHSEKLAIAFGLLNTSPGIVIRVVKNLRVCIDCHNATKFISKLVAREIVGVGTISNCRVLDML
ncbi:pentatricopeptide repeat-containing protein At4g02750 isoform X3 [Cryptomeria japonica]|uniref:pentatricopeptide repeat-containing protein At4g02750 isoform X2 n=1 Tax=Cryptomeria japonica TaxID=3369 RepID=UPI0027DA7705|nr:pentatricopeptide repeat-containing protein At4g02750 isoform X2 [Cryptomeria japonica]XP_057841169.2 pentatricopeptide repeat-containing protein At4g02750 isoform X3 [Cryptomeria japonica]XP_057841170.2 pentatricopeptide repeat-containing protein At4g02750 isoform X3 [Cryptomeria japonica]